MDNDVILKLAATQLLDDWQKTAVKEGKVRVISSAKFFFRRKKDLSRKYGEAAVKTAITFADGADTVSNVDNPVGYGTRRKAEIKTVVKPAPLTRGFGAA